MNKFLMSLILLSVSIYAEEFKVKNIGYYMDNPSIASSRSIECKKNGFTSQNEKIDCSNAIQADRKIKSQKRKKVCDSLQNEYDVKYKKDYLSFKLKKLPKEWKDRVSKNQCIIIGDERSVGW